MNKETRVDVACPKCGATDHIWFYYAEWRVGAACGASTKTGNINLDDDDIASEGPVSRAFPRMAMKMPKSFLTHEPDDSLDDACHVWVHEPSDYITEESKLCQELQDRLMLSEAGAEEILRKNYRPGDTIEVLVQRVTWRSSADQWRTRLAADVRTLIPLDESRALELVEKYAESPDCRSKATGEDVIRWALQRELT